MKKNNFKNIIQFIFVMCLIINCRTIYVHMINFNLDNILNIIFIGTVFTYLFINRHNKISFKRIIVFILICVYILIYILLCYFIKDEVSFKFVIKFGCILPALIMIMFMNKKEDNLEMLDKYSKVMLIISKVSLLFFFLGTVLNIINSTNVVNIDWGGIRNVESYFMIHFNTQTIPLFSKVLVRNTSIFVEAPMFCVNLIIAFVYEMFYRKKMSKKNIIIFTITVITTISTTGIIVVAILYFLKVLLSKKSVKIIIVPLILIIGGSTLLLLYKDKMNTNSYRIRKDDINAVEQAIKGNEILGIGYMKKSNVEKYMSDFRRYNTGLSSEILIILLQCGIYILMLYVLPTILVLIKSFNKKDYAFLSFSIVQLIFMFTMAFQYTYLALFIIAFDIAYISLEERKYNNEV